MFYKCHTLQLANYVFDTQRLKIKCLIKKMRTNLFHALWQSSAKWGQINIHITNTWKIRYQKEI